MIELTEKQEAVLKYMEDNQSVVCPTYREIAEEFDISAKGAYDHVEALIKKGFIKKIGNKFSSKTAIVKEESNE